MPKLTEIEIYTCKLGFPAECKHCVEIGEKKICGYLDGRMITNQIQPGVFYNKHCDYSKPAKLVQQK